jgi:hypothetical protein
MWPKIDRARRRLSGGATAPSTADVAVGDWDAERSEVATDPDPGPVAGRVGDVVIILGSLEVDRLRAALERMLGDAIERPDTPFRIERALSLVLARRDVPGKPRVLRRPAGLLTPESWEIHLEGVDAATGSVVLEASRTGILAP